MSKVGFPVLLGIPFDGESVEIVGRASLTPRARQTDLMTPAASDCPICFNPLYRPPAGTIAGRIVAVERGRAAVDPLPKNLAPIACIGCKVTFYEKVGDAAR